MILKPSSTFNGTFNFNTFSGGETNATSVTGELWVNGAVDGAVTVTVTNPATGQYKLTGTLGAYSAGDEIELVATATYGGITYNETVWTATVDDQLISEVYDAVENIAVTGAALNTLTTGDTLATGTESSGTDASTYTVDGVRHVITAAASTIDIYYQFSVGADGVPVSVTVTGYLKEGAPAGGDTIAIQAYNWGTTSWDTLDSAFWTGITTDTNSTKSATLFTSHVGTGANDGLVRVRFYSTTLEAGTTLNTDQIYLSYSVVRQSVGYADGAVWINTNVSNTNTTSFVDGVADNPVSTYAAAKTIAAALGLKRFRIANGSSLTLASTAANYSHIGHGWTLALNGQAIDGAYFEGASVSGTGTCTTQATFSECSLAAGTTVGPSRFFHCGFAGTVGSPFTAGSAGQFVMVDCFSEVAGSGTPYFTFSGANGVNIRRWSGGSNITFDNASSTLTMEVVTGGGQTIATAGASVELRGVCRAVTLTGVALGATCNIDAVTGPIGVNGTGGTVNIYGVCGVVTDSSGGAVTINSLGLSQANPVGSVTGSVGSVAAGGITAASVATGAIDADALAADGVAEIADAVWDEAIAGHLTPGSTGEALEASDTPTANTIADVVWNEAIADHLAAGSTGAALNGATAPSAATVADAVWDEAIAGHLAAGSTGATLNGASAPSAATVADAVWDELLAGHAIAGSAGAQLTAAGAAGDPWATLLPGSYPANSAGYIIGTYLDTKLSNCCPSSGCASATCDCSGPLGTYSL